MAGLVDRRAVSKDFAQSETTQISTLACDAEQLQSLLRSHKPALQGALPCATDRSDIYAKERELLSTEDGSNVREYKQAKRTTIENIVYGTIVGSSRISQGVTGMVGAWEYPNEKWIASRLTAAGSTAYGAGTAFNILETARVRFTDEVQTRRLAKQGLLPSQLLQRRLEGLDEMQNSMGTVLASARAPVSLAGRAVVQP